MNSYLRLREQYYYSFFDVVSELPYTSDTPDLKDILDSLGIINDLSSSNEVAETMWQWVYARHYKDYVIVSDHELTDSSEINDKVFEFFVKFNNIYNFTKEKYRTLLSVYSGALNDLMNPVEQVSNTKTRFNDTPQENGSFEDSTHTTNVTIGEATFTNDMKTKMERIEEIQNKFDNIMLRWVDEFNRLFISESQVY